MTSPRAFAADGATPLETFGFDTGNGWRTSQRRSGEASVTYGYDDAGHLTSYHKPAGAQGTTYSVDATYSYDALGQRSQSVSTTGSVTTTTTWTYDGLQLDALSATSTPSGSATSTTWSITYLYDEEGQPFAGIYRSGPTTTVFGIVTTDRGDVAELTDSGGSSFGSYRYDAWGRALSTASQGTSKVTSQLAAAITDHQILRYAGYCVDSESGLYYLSARHYDPVTMQFLQKDPAKADGECSAYQYCKGDPIGMKDPSGASGTKYGRSLWGVYRYGWWPYAKSVRWCAAVWWRRNSFEVVINYLMPEVDRFWHGAEVTFWVNRLEGADDGKASWVSAWGGRGMSQSLVRTVTGYSKYSRWHGFSIRYTTAKARRIQSITVHAELSLSWAFWNNNGSDAYYNVADAIHYPRRSAVLRFDNPYGTRKLYYDSPAPRSSSGTLRAS